MIVIVLAVVASIAAGVQARRMTERTDAFVVRLLDFVLFVLLPLIGFAFALQLELDLTTVAGIGGGYLVIATVGLIAWQVTERYLHLTKAQQGAVVLCAVLANTGYLGLPVALTVLGKDELPQAVVWDQLISVPMALIVAPFIASTFAGRHEGLHLGQRLVAIVRKAPAVPAPLIGLMVPSGWVPTWFFDVATWCVFLTLPLGFFAVGATIQRLRGSDDHPPRKAVGLVLGLRIVAAPVLFALISLAVLPEEPRAFMLQAAMPCGVNALVVGHAFDLDRGLIATAIAWSTGIVLTVTLIGSYVL